MELENKTWQNALKIDFNEKNEIVASNCGDEGIEILAAHENVIFLAPEDYVIISKNDIIATLKNPVYNGFCKNISLLDVTGPSIISQSGNRCVSYNNSKFVIDDGAIFAETKYAGFSRISMVAEYKNSMRAAEELEKMKATVTYVDDFYRLPKEK
jgi:hypothetical protein